MKEDCDLDSSGNISISTDIVVVESKIPHCGNFSGVSCIRSKQSPWDYVPLLSKAMKSVKSSISTNRSSPKKKLDKS